MWLPHAMTARGHLWSPDPSAPGSVCIMRGSHVRIFLSLLISPHAVSPAIIRRDHSESKDVCKMEAKSQISTLRSEIEEKNWESNGV